MIHHDVHTRTSYDEISRLPRWGAGEDAMLVSDIYYLRLSITAFFRRGGLDVSISISSHPQPQI